LRFVLNSNMTAQITPLSKLPTGAQARIERYLSPDPALRRFRELGMLPGTVVRVVRRAPMGDPIEVAVGASLLSIRGEHAALISVTLETTGSDE
jgi:Fe2+ transport system protein FeoA